MGMIHIAGQTCAKCHCTFSGPESRFCRPCMDRGVIERVPEAPERGPLELTHPRERRVLRDALTTLWNSPGFGGNRWGFDPASPAVIEARRQLLMYVGSVLLGQSEFEERT
jgi:hypothetical protein